MNCLLVKSVTCAALVGGLSLFGGTGANAGDLPDGTAVAAGSSVALAFHASLAWTVTQPVTSSTTFLSGSPAPTTEPALKHGIIVSVPDVNTIIEVDKRSTTDTTFIPADELGGAEPTDSGFTALTSTVPNIAITTCILSACTTPSVVVIEPPATPIVPVTAITAKAPAATAGTAGTATLAFTGVDAAPLLAGGFLILLLGTGMLVAGHRRSAL